MGCVPDLPLQRLQSFLGALYLRRSGLHADVTLARTADQLARLRAGELVLGLIHDPGGAVGIAIEPVFRGERLGAFLPPGHRLAARGALRPPDLRHELLLVAPRAADPALADHLCAQLARAGLRFGAVREVSGSDVRELLLAVADSRGVMLGPLSLPRTAGEIGTIVSAHALEPPLRMPDTAVAWRSAAPPGLNRLLDAARAVARELRATVEADEGWR